MPDRGIIGVVGASGAGKSSFLYCLAGMKNKFLTGDIYFEGVKYSQSSDDEICKLRREKFGFIFQKHFLIPYLTVKENVVVGINDTRYLDEVDKYLAILQIGKYKDKKISILSGGQCQRVAVARGILNNPKVIFADEPTAALDSVSRKLVMDLLKEKSKNSLILLVTHDKEVSKYFDNEIIFSNGEVVFKE